MARQAESKGGLHSPDLKKTIEENIDKDKLKAQFKVSHFGANAVLRGMQLTLVGAHRALQNPALFNNDHYKQAATAVVAGLGIRLLVTLPVSCPLVVVCQFATDYSTPVADHWYQTSFVDDIAVILTGVRHLGRHDSRRPRVH